ncbi:hypothetical protein [Bacteroides sedimenti]
MGYNLEIKGSGWQTIAFSPTQSLVFAPLPVRNSLKGGVDGVDKTTVFQF